MRLTGGVPIVFFSMHTQTDAEQQARLALANALESFIAGVPLIVKPSSFGLTPTQLVELAYEVARESPLRIDVDWRVDGLVFCDARH